MLWHEATPEDISVIVMAQDLFLVVAVIFMYMLITVIDVAVPDKNLDDGVTEASRIQVLTRDSQNADTMETAAFGADASVVVDEGGALHVNGAAVADLGTLLEMLRSERASDSTPLNVVVVVRPATRFQLVAPVLQAIASIPGTKTHLQQSDALSQAR